MDRNPKEEERGEHKDRPTDRPQRQDPQQPQRERRDQGDQGEMQREPKRQR